MPTYHYFYNRYFFAGNYRPSLHLPGLTQTSSREGLLQADCVVVHLPSILSTNLADQLARLRSTAPARQIWVAESLESAVNFPQMDDPKFMALFNIEVSYRQSADIWTPYIPTNLPEDYAKVTIGSRKKNLCAFISSNWDESGRRAYVRDLFRHLDVHSYGKFMRNKRLLLDRGISTKLRVMKKYAFTLAFENSIETDYVTEKFYQPLMSGCIPVYLGAPNIGDFAPGERCFVNACDFETPARLADFIKQADPEEFQSWRRHDLRPSFKNLMKRIEYNWQYQLAELILRHLST